MNEISSRYGASIILRLIWVAVLCGIAICALVAVMAVPRPAVPLSETFPLGALAVIGMLLSYPTGERLGAVPY
ncbi:MAG TPA: hypothetical protein VNA04_11985 [Thermoanaerobaculia bacterium]|nr:hypothetical protein [Thermoanaerobaculia bacterium]